MSTAQFSQDLHLYLRICNIDEHKNYFDFFALLFKGCKTENCQNADSTY